MSSSFASFSARTLSGPSENAILAHSNGLVSILAALDRVLPSLAESRDCESQSKAYDSKAKALGLFKERDSYGEKSNGGSVVRVERPPFDFMRSFRKADNSSDEIFNVFSQRHHDQLLNAKDESGVNIWSVFTKQIYLKSDEDLSSDICQGRTSGVIAAESEATVPTATIVDIARVVPVHYDLNHTTFREVIHIIENGSVGLFPAVEWLVRDSFNKNDQNHFLHILQDYIYIQIQLELYPEVAFLYTVKVAKSAVRPFVANWKTHDILTTPNLSDSTIFTNLRFKSYFEIVQLLVLRKPLLALC